MAIDRERMLDIAGLEQRIGGLSGLGGLNFLGGGLPPVNIPAINIPAIQGPILGPDDFGSYTIPVSDPTYRSGFDYARSIAGGMPMEQVIAPGVSYSPEMPMGYTQAQLNTPVGTTPVEPPPTQEPDDPRYLGTGIGGVNIPVDRKDIPFRNIFGANISNLIDLGKINKNLQYMSQKAKEAGITGTGGVDLTGESLRRVYDEGRGLFQNMGNTFKIDQEAIDRIVQERIAERMPTIEQPDFSQFVRREDLPTFKQPDLTGFARLEDIPQIPTREDFLSIAREGIDIPQYQAPDLSAYDTRLADLEQELAGLKQPTGGSFSISQPAPRGLF